MANSLRRIVIAGPTGIGKTSVSLKLAALLKNSHPGTAIISADSRQCYSHLDIGTGKVTSSEMTDVMHYNISLLSPNESDTAAAFAKRARTWEEDIHAANGFPVVVGGSTLHLQSLVWPLDDVPAACVYNQIQLSEQEKNQGPEFLMHWLGRVDPVYAKRMDGFNRHRVFRALDVFMQTGVPFSHFHSEQKLEVVPDDTLLFVLTCARETLVQRIESRVDTMIQQGLVDEVRQILDMGYDRNLQSLQTVGYKEIIEYLDGKLSLDEAIDRIKINTRQYSKRQATWFRRWKSAINLDSTSQTSAEIASTIYNTFTAHFDGSGVK